MEIHLRTFTNAVWRIVQTGTPLSGSRCPSCSHNWRHASSRSSANHCGMRYETEACHFMFRSAAASDSLCTWVANPHVAVEQPGARVVCDQVQAAGRAAQGADAVGVAALVLHHVAVPVDAVQVQDAALRAFAPCVVVFLRPASIPLDCDPASCCTNRHCRSSCQHGVASYHSRLSPLSKLAATAGRNRMNPGCPACVTRARSMHTLARHP